MATQTDQSLQHVARRLSVDQTPSPQRRRNPAVILLPANMLNRQMCWQLSHEFTLNKFAFQLKVDHPRVCIQFRTDDFDLDPVTSILDLDLDVLKM